MISETGQIDNLTVVMGIVTILVALTGVWSQNYSATLLKLGEEPSHSGMFLTAPPESLYGRSSAWHHDLRSYYRESSAELSIIANDMLLISAVVGVFTGWTSIPFLHISSIIASLVFFSVVFFRWRQRRTKALAKERLLSDRRHQLNLERATDPTDLKYNPNNSPLIKEFERATF